MRPHDQPDNPQPASQRPEVDDDGLIRLQKLLAQSGVASRRKCEELMLDGQQARLTQAALETLAVVAYKQPVSRARVSAIRGVNVDGVMRTLLTRGLVEEAGEDHSTGAHLYRTTTYFLERIGVTSLDELPELAPDLPDLDDLDDLEDELGGSPAVVATGSTEDA